MFSQEMPEDFDAPRFLADLREADGFDMDVDQVEPHAPGACLNDRCKVVACLNARANPRVRLAS